MNPERPLPEHAAPRSGIRDSLIGVVVAGRYRIIRLIAKGGMGAVYEAEQVPLGRKVAIKILQEPPNSPDSAAFEQRFFLEASSLARLSHPHTVTLHDYGQTDDGTYYLVMEYVDGQPLSRLLQAEGPLPAERAIRIMLQVARAVFNAHRNGIVHRDLKPSNLLVCKTVDGEDYVKVVDFGLAKLTEGDQSITVTGMILGSPHCMAPEQVHGAEVDERTDIYALGILLFRSLTGRYPFHGPTTTATMIAHIQNPVPRLAEVVPDLVAPDGLEDIIRTALAKDPDDRFRSMGEMIQALAAVGEIPQEEFSAVSTLAVPRRTVPLLPVLGLVAALLAVVAGVVWWSTQRTPPGPVSVEITVHSQPTGATVFYNGQNFGTTPALFTLSSEHNPDVRRFEVQLDGYLPQAVEKDISTAPSVSLSVDLKRDPRALERVLEQPAADPSSATPPPDLRRDPRPDGGSSRPDGGSRPTSDPTPPPKDKAQPQTDKVDKDRGNTPKPDAGGDPNPDDGSSTPAGYKSNPFD